MKFFLISALLAATAAALPQGLGQITRIAITEAQPTALAVPRNAEPQRLGPVSRTMIYDSKPTALSVPRNDAPHVAKRQSIGGLCSNNEPCAAGWVCTPLEGGYNICIPDFLLPLVEQSEGTVSRTNIGNTPVNSEKAIQLTIIVVAGRE
ncbi:hypothetical protein V493_03554 [Pseudogymnoascus sp. VKM F-4281 (FW-2241)]|nr:hypothetical protein V493_03554 [Pseudogymnoascus sp. VKM F-4281 (FW-2241)]